MYQYFPYAFYAAAGLIVAVAALSLVLAIRNAGGFSNEPDGRSTAGHTGGAETSTGVGGFFGVDGGGGNGGGGNGGFSGGGGGSGGSDGGGTSGS